MPSWPSWCHTPTKKIAKTSWCLQPAELWQDKTRLTLNISLKSPSKGFWRCML